MRILFAGSAAHSAQVLNHLLELGHDVVGVLTRPDARQGRGRKYASTPVRKLAEERGIPVLVPRQIDVETIEQISQLGASVAVVVAYGLLIPPAALEILESGWFNIHYSVLPRWRGAAPVQYTIAAGDRIGGVTIFQIEEGLDSGPIAGQVTTEILDSDTSESLLQRLHELSLPLLEQVLVEMQNGTLSLVNQPREGITKAPKITVESARLDWSRPWCEIDRAVRAFAPRPGAWTTLEDGKRIKVLQVSRDQEKLAPGLIQFDKKQVLVGTGTEAARLDTVAPAGKTAMPGADWARGARLNLQTILGGE